MRLHRNLILPALMAAIALAGCQTIAPTGGVRMGLGAVSTETVPAAAGTAALTIRLGAETPTLGDRTLQSVVSDIAYVTVTVQPLGFAEVSQTLLKASLAGGTGAVTFTNLPSVATTVQILAYDAGSKVIGSGTQHVTVAPGVPTVVNFAIPLNPTYILPTGTLSGNVSFKDGATIVGTPPAGVVTPTGTILQTLKTDGGPEGIAFDKGGNAWIPAFKAGAINRFDPAGTALPRIIDGPLPPALPSDPAAIAFDAAGNAWVANYGNGTVASFDRTGKPLATIPVGLYPTAVAFDLKGNLWVVNYFGNNIVILNVATGKPAGIIKVGSNPISVAFDAIGNAYVLSLKSKDITKLSPLGIPVATYALGDAPQGMAFDAAGNLWVTNNASNTLMKFDPSGLLLGTYPTGRRPRGVAIDRNGCPWVANTDDGTVTRFSQSGANTGTYRTGLGPRNLAFDAAGTLWVANYDAGTVVKLAP